MLLPVINICSFEQHVKILDDVKTENEQNYSRFTDLQPLLRHQIETTDHLGFQICCQCIKVMPT